VPAVRQRIGIVFQQFNLFPHLRVLDNLTLRVAAVGHVSAGGRTRARTTFSRVSDSPTKARSYPHQLSGGSNSASRSRGR
jgi:ABC-type polar amino acid transport system ATPase subunit